MDKQKQRQLLFEFLRYVLVGGVAFVVDAGVLAAAKELFFKNNCTAGQMAVCVAGGFVAGLAANYLLSNLFVFRSAEQRERGRSFKAFLVYAAVGVVGFGLTELLMYLGVSVVGSDGLWYLAVKCAVAAVVLVWNYVGRKLFVYQGK